MRSRQFSFNARIYMRGYNISLTSNAAGIMSLVCNNHVRA